MVGIGRAVLGCAVAVAFFSACSERQPPGPARPGEEPRQILYDYKTTESDSGFVRYVLRGKVARFYDAGVVRAEGFEVDFYERGQKVSALRAEQGFLDGDGRLRALGHVVVTSTEGAVLTTDELYWDRQKGKIRADGDFRIVDTGEPLTGRGLTTDPALTLVAEGANGRRREHDVADLAKPHEQDAHHTGICVIGELDNLVIDRRGRRSKLTPRAAASGVISVNRSIASLPITRLLVYPTTQFHGSIVASSMSITGMSSLIG